ncbi:MAG: glycine/sarcosine/betaine reductase selenoprotein B family protein [Reyranellaceae bacterium]
MVRLLDLPEWEREHLLGKNLAPLGPTPWVESDRPLAERRIALVTTAGLHFRDDEGFRLNDASYRVIPGERDAADLVMSHASVNFDRTGFQDDVNVVFPIDRFRELVADGTIGSLAAQHVSFMGAGLLPQQYEQSVRALAGLLRRDGVDTVFLTPV